MAKLRTEHEVDKMIEALMKKGSSNYITQSVLFKKDSPQQIELLRNVLIHSTSFGDFVRKLLVYHFNEEN